MLKYFSNRHDITYLPLRAMPPKAKQIIDDFSVRLLNSQYETPSGSQPVLKGLKDLLRKPLGNVYRRLKSTILEPDLFYSWGEAALKHLRPVLSQVKASDFDLAIVDHTGFSMLLDLLPAEISKSINVENVGFYNGEHMLKREKHVFSKLWALYYQQWMSHADARAVKRADLILAMCGKEQEWLAAHTSAKVVVAPIVTDLNYFQHLSEKWVPPTNGQWIVFTGNMAHLPNIDAVLYFHAQILPIVRESLPEVGFAVVGMEPPEEVQKLAQKDRLTVVTGKVPDVRPYVAASDVFIVPMRIGAGIRIKIMEAMAMEKTVVSTSMGCEGLGLTAGENILVADDPLSFAKSIKEVLSNSELRGVISSRAHAFAKNNFDYRVQCAQIEEEWLALVGSHDNIAQGVLTHSLLQ